MKRLAIALILPALLLPVLSTNAQDIQDILSQMGAGTGKATYEKKYTFDTYIQMEVSDPGNTTLLYDAYVNKDGINYAVYFSQDGAKATVVFDGKNNSVLMLSEDDGEKTGIAMSVNPEMLAAMGEEFSEGKDDYSPFKTGKSKSILGYKCNEYLIKQEGTEIHMWVSEELADKVSKEMLKNQQVFGGAFVYATTMNGMVMEYDYRDGDSGQRMTFLVTKIDLNASKSIDISGYSVMSLGQ